jgi:X-X-X-Leu-X-X-Gly heptad repeat protein
MSIKRWIISIIVFIPCLLMAMPSALAVGSSKNETVYALLNNDGSVEKIYVVNQLIGEYTDYGVYTDIKNLSTTSVPLIDEDRITFPDKNVEGGLYYQGTMSAELPMIIRIGYTLNGQPVDAVDLSGASGKLEITINCSINPDCDEAVRDGLMTQISLALDMQRATDIIAPESTIVSAGRTANISNIILPGESASISINATVQDFRMDPITITLLKGTMSISGIEDTVSEFEDGFDDMYTGTDDMVEGTTELKDGMVSLLDGVGEIKNGLKRLKTGGAELHAGMVEYGSGLNAFIDGVQNLSQPSSDIMHSINELSDGGAALAQNISVISDNLTGLAASGADLKALAESLSASDDPNVAALANGTLQTLAALNELSLGLETASGGVDDYVFGVEQVALGYPSFHNGLLGISDGGSQLVPAFSRIVDSVSEYSNGVSRISTGANRLHSSINGLPDDIQKLIDGQLEFRDGIASAKDDITEKTSIFIADDDPPVSFAAPLKNHPDSIQYILTTSGIKERDIVIQLEEPAESEDFLTRLAALFK